MEGSGRTKLASAGTRRTQYMRFSRVKAETVGDYRDSDSDQLGTVRSRTNIPFTVWWMDILTGRNQEKSNLRPKPGVLGLGNAHAKSYGRRVLIE